MSPFVYIEYNNGVDPVQKIQTEPSVKGDKNPKWSKSKFTLKVTDPTIECKIIAYSDNSMIGFNFVKISDMMLNKGSMNWYTILFDNKAVGKV